MEGTGGAQSGEKPWRALWYARAAPPMARNLVIAPWTLFGVNQGNSVSDKQCALAASPARNTKHKFNEPNELSWPKPPACCLRRRPGNAGPRWE